MENCTLPKKLLKEIDISADYHLPNKLKQCGDIHPNPGPARSNQQPNSTKYLLKIIMLAIFIIIKIEQLKNKELSIEKSNPIQQRFFEGIALLHIKPSRTFVYSNKNKNKINNKYCFLTVLLLLSGDVKQNPGPTSNCFKCKKPTKTEKITCEKCKNTFHINCCKKQNTNSIPYRENSRIANFSWICPNETCQPNYSISSYVENSNMNNKNKFEKLKLANEKPVKRKYNKNTTLRPKVIKKKKNNSTNLWNELTSITAKDYIGQELCYHCFKQIKSNTYAGECSICKQRAHIKCQRITVKAYKENKNKGYNTRICGLCSTNEEETIQKIDINKLKYDDKPEKFNNIKTGKNELLILHLNARSIMNKIEEINMICAQTKPDILCITETWLNDSVPLNAITPNG